MKAIRLFLAACACALPLVAAAQWQWVDKDGRKVFSDRPPPADTPQKNILKQPGNARLPVQAPAAQADPAATPVAAAAAAPAAAAASAPKLSGKDKALEDKKKQADAADAAKKKADEEKFAQAKTENCARARQSKATLDSGHRIAQINQKGEKEFLDDKQREAEVKRVDALIARDCAK
jgi:hypothetical protein